MRYTSWIDDDSLASWPYLHFVTRVPGHISRVKTNQKTYNQDIPSGHNEKDRWKKWSLDAWDSDQEEKIVELNTSNVPNKIRHKSNHLQSLTKAIPSCTAPQATTMNVSQYWTPTLRSARFPGSWLIRNWVSIYSALTLTLITYRSTYGMKKRQITRLYRPPSLRCSSIKLVLIHYAHVEGFLPG